MIKRLEKTVLAGEIRVPPSKSDAQRAFLAAALSQGTSIITGYGKSDDERAMLTAIQKLGATVEPLNDFELRITGLQKTPDDVTISAGESGLGIRLLTAVCSAFSAKTTLKGEGSLLTRPLDFYSTVLPKLNVRIASNQGCAPLEVQGPMNGGEITVDGSMSSQFISGLLMALPMSKSDTKLAVLDLKSGPYVSMTLLTLRAFGIDIQHDALDHFFIKGNQVYHPTNYSIDADWSSASYWLVAAAIGHPITISGLNRNSLQADKALLNALEKANCMIHQTEKGLQIDGRKRRPFTFDATDCPDLFPALVALAASINGTTTITGTTRLVHKESHRGLSLKSEYEKLGVQIELLEDEMCIFGTGKVSGGKVHAHHDHRIAMCLAISATKANDVVEIEGAEAVSKSYPDFWLHLESLSTSKKPA